MREKTEKKRLAILRLLKENDKPLGSPEITERLMAMGHDISERTVRFHLLAMDKAGFTENFGRRGRRITAPGQKELETARIIEKVGFLSAKIDQMTYRMNFDLAAKTGTVVINLSIIEKEKLKIAVPLIKRVFEEGYAMGELLSLLGPGEHIGEIPVPEGMVGIGTVCSITLNGVLLHHGIPTISRFGALLELKEKKPLRFAEIINYDGTSLDPLEIFIRSGMTDYTGATITGNGRIGAGFREVPGESRDQVIELARKLEKIGLGGFMIIGWPGQPVLEIPVSEGQVGAVVIGGLNPVAILEETGIRVHSRALAGLTDYSNLFHYKEFDSRINRLN
ncbi:MAG: NrpR regulatory domain-containing protein [Thermodesulfobacteriota bacterium]|nr:NrpR regulatory domain-containing protein [Thermodesulfobacteriota bacterium]